MTLCDTERPKNQKLRAGCVIMSYYERNSVASPHSSVTIMKRRSCSSTISRIASILLLTGTSYLCSAEIQLKFTHGHHDASSMTAANKNDVGSSPRLLFRSPDYFEEESFIGSAAAKARTLVSRLFMIFGLFVPLQF